MPAAHGRAGDNPGPPKAGLAAIAVAAAAMLCCVAAPLLTGALGGLALGSVFGVGVGVLAISLLLAFIVVRLLRRRADRAQSGGRA